MSKKLIAWSVVPVCLFLIILGMRIPNLGPAPATPKPRPRAIIESSYKTAQDASAGDQIALEVSHQLPEPHPLKVFPICATGETGQFNSVARSRSGARAPPLSIS